MGALGPQFLTSVKDMKARYNVWCRMPTHGVQPFTCSPNEFERDYSGCFPYRLDEALSAVQGARADE